MAIWLFQSIKNHGFLARLGEKKKSKDQGKDLLDGSFGFMDVSGVFLLFFWRVLMFFKCVVARFCFLFLVV